MSRKGGFMDQQEVEAGLLEEADLLEDFDPLEDVDLLEEDDGRPPRRSVTVRGALLT